MNLPVADPSIPTLERYLIWGSILKHEQGRAIADSGAIRRIGLENRAPRGAWQFSSDWIDRLLADNVIQDYCPSVNVCECQARLQRPIVYFRLGEPSRWRLDTVIVLSSTASIYPTSAPGFRELAEWSTGYGGVQHVLARGPNGWEVIPRPDEVEEQLFMVGHGLCE